MFTAMGCTFATISSADSNRFATENWGKHDQIAIERKRRESPIVRVIFCDNASVAVNNWCWSIFFYLQLFFLAANTIFGTDCGGYLWLEISLFVLLKLPKILLLFATNLKLPKEALWDLLKRVCGTFCLDKLSLPNWH